MAPLSERMQDSHGMSLEPLVGPEVSVVIITHEHRGHIAACLASLERLSDVVSREVIVVDNASTDGTPERVACDFPGVTLIRGDRRRGFSANANRGAAVARGRHLMFLNPDTVVFSDALDLLVRYVDEHPEVGCVGPRLVYPDGSLQASARRYPDLLTTVIRRTPLRWALAGCKRELEFLMLDEGTAVHDRDVDWMLGAALVLRRDAFDEIGGFDEGYRLYCEDMDLCWRLQAAGWAVRLLPEAVVQHELGEMTRKRFFTVRTAWHLRSMARFVRLHGIPGHRRRPRLQTAYA